MSTKDLGVFLLPHLTLIATWNNQEIMNTTSIWAANVCIRINLIFLGKVVVGVEIVDKLDLRQSSAWTLYHWIRDSLVFSLLQGQNNENILIFKLTTLMTLLNRATISSRLGNPCSIHLCQIAGSIIWPLKADLHIEWVDDLLGGTVDV